MALDFNIPSQVKTFATVGDFPTAGEAKTIYIALDSKLVYIYDSGTYTSIGDSTSAEWGHISGDITSQTDLQTLLDGKFNNPTGDTTQYLDGAGTPTTFPTMLSADKMVTIGRNATGSTLYKGTIVYISGSTGNRPNFVKAQANAESTSAGTFGVIEADIPNNADGNCVTIGTIDNLDTRSSAPHPFTSDTLADGDTIYLSPTTAGYITNVKPSAPNHLVYLGKVVRTSPTNGTIVYRVQNGYELDELHDVTTTDYTTPQDEDSLLILDSTQTLWKRLTLYNLRVFLKTYFDTIYQNVITPGTTSQYYRGDKTFQTLDKNAVGLANVDNTSDANKPVSTAQATAIALKENSANKAATMTGNTTSNTLFLTSKAIYDWATGLFQTILVSGTNIKTINGSSVLGSGDIAISSGVTDVTGSNPIVSTGGATPDISIRQSSNVDDGYLSSTDWNTFNGKQPTLVSGTNIKTINGSSVLGSGDLAISGGLLGVHALLFLPSASITNQMVTVSNTISGSLSANAIVATPFIPAQNITTSNLFMQVSTLFAGALCRIAIYSNVNGLPSNLLYVSSDLNMSTTGNKVATTTFNFVAGTTYWLAIHGGTTGTANISAIPTNSLMPIKASVGSSSFTTIIGTATFTSGTPSTFPTPTFASANSPYIGITKA